MKKIYLNPEIVVVKIQPMQMLSASDLLKPEEGSGTTGGWAPEGGEGEGRGSDWDED